MAKKLENQKLVIWLCAFGTIGGYILETMYKIST